MDDEEEVGEEEEEEEDDEEKGEMRGSRCFLRGWEDR